MIITKLHLDFYRHKKCTPEFAKLIDKPLGCGKFGWDKMPEFAIDEMINSQLGKPAKNNDMDCAVYLLKMFIIGRRESQYISKGSYHDRTAVEFMEDISKQCKVRKRFYLRWIRQYRKSMTRK